MEEGELMHLLKSSSRWSLSRSLDSISVGPHTLKPSGVGFWVTTKLFESPMAGTFEYSSSSLPIVAKMFKKSAVVRAVTAIGRMFGLAVSPLLLLSRAGVRSVEICIPILNSIDEGPFVGELA
jgi:hypothetical protein